MAQTNPPDHQHQQRPATNTAEHNTATPPRITNQQWKTLNALQKGWVDLDTLAHQLHTTHAGATITCSTLRKHGYIKSSAGMATINGKRRQRIGYVLTPAGEALLGATTDDGV